MGLPLPKTHRCRLEPAETGFNKTVENTSGGRGEMLHRHFPFTVFWKEEKAYSRICNWAFFPFKRC